MEQILDDIRDIERQITTTKRTLREKWYKGSPESIFSPCAFCEAYGLHFGQSCIGCKCPPEICANHGHEGLVGQMARYYGKATAISMLDSEDLEKIIETFESHLRALEANLASKYIEQQRMALQAEFRC